MSQVFVISVKAHDGYELREFIVNDERIAVMLRKLVFEKSATEKEMIAFAAEVAADPALKQEWDAIQQHLGHNLGPTIQ